MDAAVSAGVFVIAFTAANCPPCDTFKADLADEQFSTAVQIVVIDVAEAPDRARECGVTRTPTFVAIDDERQVARLVGYGGGARLCEWLSRLKQ